jgi:hypothetical protein
MTHVVDAKYNLIKKEWNVYPFAPPMSRITIESNLFSREQLDRLYVAVSKEVACIVTEKKVQP